MKHLIWIVFLCLMAAGCARGSEPTEVPTAINTLVPSNTPVELPTQTPTLEPTQTTDGSIEQVDPEATEEAPLEIIIEAAEGQELPAPIAIALPEGWTQQDGTVLLEDIQGLDILPFTAYVGPVTGGDGFIIVVWGFGSLVYGNPFANDFRPIDLKSDGLRLLYLAVMDVRCIVSPDETGTLEFLVGGQPAVGTTFSAVNCPENEDTQGWYAALRQEQVNYVFYAYTEPQEAIEGTAADELQAILDSVQFQFEERYGETLSATQAPEPATDTP